MTEGIGIAGSGRMGTAFARRLIQKGHSVTIWNRTLERLADAISAGAKQASDLKDLSACDTIILSLTNFEAVDVVINGLADAGINGKLIIEMSTLLPAEQEKIAQTATSAGAGFVECPVGGTVGPALKGQLLGMAGGSKADFDRAAPLLETLCRRVEYLGPAGSGARMKLAINLPLAIYWETLGEAMTLLRNSDISVETALSLMADSSGGPNVLKNRLQVVIDTLNGNDQIGTFDIAGLSKDLKLALQLARREGASLPLANVAEQVYDAALSKGLGQFDGSTLSRKSD